MNPAVSHLLCLRQSNRAIKEYVEDFCGLCHLVGFNDVALKDIFRAGLNKPIRSQLPGGKIHWSLEQYIDHALLLSGSLYTVGVAEEECNNPPVSAKPESPHVMPATPESAHVMPATPESAHLNAGHARVCLRHAGHARVCLRHAGHARVCLRHAGHARVCSRHAGHQNFPKGIFFGGYSTQASADAKLGPGLIASVMDPPLMLVQAAGIPRASALAVTETVPLTSVLPVMAGAILCVWAAHRTPEASSVQESAPEPPEVAASTAEPPEVAASAAEPSNVMAPTNELMVCPVTATEAVPELTVMATKAVLELTVCPVTAVPELTVMAMKAIPELTVCPVTVTEAVPEFTATEAPALPAPPWPPALPAPPWPPAPPLLHAPGPVPLHGLITESLNNKINKIKTMNNYLLLFVFY